MRRILALLLLLLWPAATVAQQAATLLADHVSVDPNGTLTASGNVEVFFDGTRLSAAQITYSKATDSLDISGPIYLSSPDGTVITANRAELSATLETGLLLSARMVLDQQLQLAAQRIDRVEGGYTQLSRVAATSCSVCDGRPPLWDIRASRIVHDTNEHQLYIDNAVLRVRGLPIFWLPTMRMPDPTLSRATGFLIPRYRSNDLLGIGIKLPYFIKIGDHRDLTLTPYISSKTNTLEARYRQAFLNGDLAISAAVSDDALTNTDLRGYLSIDGSFSIERGYTLGFSGNVVSDAGYLQQYGYADTDRLESTLWIQRINDDGFTSADLTVYQSLLDGVSTDGLPPFVASFATEQKSALWGGMLRLGADADLHLRFGPDNNGVERDMARVGASVDWRRRWITGGGLVFGADTALQGDIWQIADDPLISSGYRISPSAALTVRYPLRRVAPNGAVDVLEPVAMIGWAGDFGKTVPNEDSVSAEFDAGNLFSLSRFPGDDRIETGFQAAYGVSWQHVAPDGWSGRLLFGQVVRETAGDFTQSSGLTGTVSDILVSGQVTLNNGLNVYGRTLLDNTLSAGKTEIGAGWETAKVGLDASYIWLPADPAEDRISEVSEWTISGDYQINDVWSVGLSGRYDIANDSPVTSGLSLGWQNECVTVELSASRRYTSSTTVAPTTDYNLSVGLAGFGSGATGLSPRRACSN